MHSFFSLRSRIKNLKEVTVGQIPSMVSKIAYLSVLAIACGIDAFPGGAPGSACKSMTPSHGVDPQPISTSPYSVKALLSETQDKIAGRYTEHYQIMKKLEVRAHNHASIIA